MPVSVDRDRVCTALEEAIPRVTGQIRSAPDPDAIAVGHWTVTDLSAHLADVFSRYPAMLRGERTAVPHVDSVSEVNEAGIKARSDRDLALLADDIDSGASEELAILRDGDPQRIVNWSEDIAVPISSIAALGLGECLVHGFDLARAAGRSWPIGRDEVGLTLLGVAPFLPHYTSPEATKGFTGTYELRLRGGPRLRLAFVDGELTVSEPDGGPVDCYISADPIAYLLVGYGRRNQWGAALTGKLMSYGRKPWLGLKLASMLRNP
jgi:uncharacterized protein (TIGR03083 family)